MEKDLHKIWKEEMKVEPVIETDAGAIYIQPSDDGTKLEYGTVSNIGLLASGDMEYDFDFSLDENIQALADIIFEEYGYPDFDESKQRKNEEFDNKSDFESVAEHMAKWLKGNYTDKNDVFTVTGKFYNQDIKLTISKKEMSIEFPLLKEKITLPQIDVINDDTFTICTHFKKEIKKAYKELNESKKNKELHDDIEYNADNELALYIINDGRMYNKFCQPAMEKIRNGQEDEIDWFKIAIEGARRYAREITPLHLDREGYQETAEYLKDYYINLAKSGIDESFSETELVQIGSVEDTGKKYKIYQNKGGEIFVTDKKLNDNFALMGDYDTFDEVLNEIDEHWEDNATYILYDLALLKDKNVTDNAQFDDATIDSPFIRDLSSDYADKNESRNVTIDYKPQIVKDDDKFIVFLTENGDAVKYTDTIEEAFEFLKDKCGFEKEDITMKEIKTESESKKLKEQITKVLNEDLEYELNNVEKDDFVHDFEVPVKITFSGTVTVRCESEGEADYIVERYFGATIGNCGDGGNDAIVDWDIDIHGETEIDY